MFWISCALYCFLWRRHSRRENRFFKVGKGGCKRACVRPNCSGTHSCCKVTSYVYNNQYTWDLSKIILIVSIVVMPYQKIWPVAVYRFVDSCLRLIIEHALDKSIQMSPTATCKSSFLGGARILGDGSGLVSFIHQRPLRSCTRSRNR